MSWRHRLHVWLGGSDVNDVSYLGDVQRLELNPGDRVVLSVDYQLSFDVAAKLREQLERQLSGHTVIVLGAGMKLGVIGAKK